jgi:hypothetical protein
LYIIHHQVNKLAVATNAVFCWFIFRKLIKVYKAFVDERRIDPKIVTLFFKMPEQFNNFKYLRLLFANCMLTAQSKTVT